MSNWDSTCPPVLSVSAAGPKLQFPLFLIRICAVATVFACANDVQCSAVPRKTADQA